jgi:hypothetical protein
MSAVPKSGAPKAKPEKRVATPSGIEVPVVVTREMAGGADPGRPAEYPYTRGIFADGYRGRPWTIRQYSGFGSAEESNQRYRFLLDQGQTGLSVALDLPTQCGYDPDDAMARPRYKDETAPVILGIDPARGGADSTVIVVRQGRDLIAIKRYSGEDTMMIVGRVIDAIEEYKPTLAVIDEGGLGFVVPFDRPIIMDVQVPKGEARGAAAGEMVAVTITRWPTPARPALGRITEVLGAIGAPGVDTAVIIRKYGGYPEGVCYAILLMNTAVPLIEEAIRIRTGESGLDAI